MISPMLLQGILPKGSLGDLFQNSNQVNGLVGGQKQFAGILSQMLGARKNDAAKGSLGKTAFGHAFLEQLKKKLMASGTPLDQFVANEQALNSFAKLLVGAGFKQKEVTALVTDLKESGSKYGGVLLSDLFKAASHLSPARTKIGNTPKFDISALPYIETILSRLGASPGQVQDALSDAKGLNGIDIQKLVSNLQKILSGIDPQKSANANSKEQKDLIAMMQRIGLLDDDSETVSQLNRLIADLKKNEKFSLTEGNADLDIAAVILHLEQVASQLGIKDSTLKGMIADAKENSRMSRKALIERLAQLRDGIVEKGHAGIGKTQGEALPGQNNQTGTLTLGKFVAALEARLASDNRMENSVAGAFTHQGEKETANDFFQKVVAIQDNAEKKAAASIPRPIAAGEESVASNVRPGKNIQKGGTPFSVVDSKHSPAANSTASGKNMAADSGTEQQSQNFMGKSRSEKADDVLMNLAKSRQDKPLGREVTPSDTFVKELKISEATAANHTKAASPRTLPGYLLDQVSRQIIRLRQTNQHEMTLQLKPPHLGRMKMSIEQSNNGIKVNIIVEQAATKDMLLAQANELKAALADQGVRFDKIDVETQADFDRSMAQARQDAGQSGSRRGREFQKVPGAKAVNSVIGPEEVNPARDNGLLNLVV